MYEQQLYSITKYAYENVPLYRKLKESRVISITDILDKGKWDEIPLLSKKDAVLDAENMISDTYLGMYVTGQLLRMHTSGSTGTCLDVYWDKMEYYSSLLPLWMMRKKIAGIVPNDRVCFFNTYLSEDTPFSLKNNQLIISKANMNEERIVEIYNTIKRFSPKWMLLQPSMAVLLSEVKVKRGLESIPSLKYIELTGEMSLARSVEFVKKVFSCNVYKHYGMMEMSCIGYEKGNMYQLFESSTYVEVLDKKGNPCREGEEGKIYVTSLQNHVMPFVRYETGDLGKLVPTDLSKERTRCIQLSKARENDLIEVRKGIYIPPDSLLAPIELFNNLNKGGIYQFQARQKRINELELHFVIDSELELCDIKEFFLHEIKNEEWLFDKKLDFILDEFIMPLEATGKVKWFIKDYYE